MIYEIYTYKCIINFICLIMKLLSNISAIFSSDLRFSIISKINQSQFPSFRISTEINKSKTIKTPNTPFKPNLNCHFLQTSCLNQNTKCFLSKQVV